MNQSPCPFCGGDSYVWGEARAQGMRFSPDSEGWLEGAFRFTTALRARRCETCRNVQIFDIEEGEETADETP